MKRRPTNAEVVHAFIRGEAAGVPALYTDGIHLYSGGQPIARRHDPEEREELVELLIGNEWEPVHRRHRHLLETLMELADGRR